MSRIVPSRLDEERSRLATKERVRPRHKAAAETLDDIELQFLEPVARYLAILQEWSLERLSDDAGNVPQSESP
jgi:hypothetical protein